VSVVSTSQGKTLQFLHIYLFFYFQTRQTCQLMTHPRQNRK